MSTTRHCTCKSCCTDLWYSLDVNCTLFLNGARASRAFPPQSGLVAWKTRTARDFCLVCPVWRLVAFMPLRGHLTVVVLNFPINQYFVWFLWGWTSKPCFQHSSNWFNCFRNFIKFQIRIKSHHPWQYAFAIKEAIKIVLEGVCDDCGLILTGGHSLMTQTDLLVSSWSSLATRDR